VRAVLDTNVLVSALLSPEGACARVLAAAGTGRLIVVLDERILAEYKMVLSRPKFGFDGNLVEALTAQLHALAENVTVSSARLALPDEGDVKFVEVALAARADCIITGNARHFPVTACQGVSVLTPQQFLAGL